MTGDEARGDPVDGPRHGTAAPRGLAASSSPARYARMFPDLPRRDPGAAAIEALAERMEAAADSDDENTRIAAGYTYLAQFVDHDITFDAMSQLGRDNEPAALANLRSPRLDLDSLYGGGPADQPYLYDWTRGPYAGVKLLVGGDPESDVLAPIDLPRNAQGRALIGDPRNDENLIVSQLHLLFVQFHNAVVERVHSEQRGLTRNELFDEARRLVRWHYQWIVVGELLETIVGTTLAKAVRPRMEADVVTGILRPSTQRRLFALDGPPTIPVEFSGAAYRFGHTMVRNAYLIRDDDTVEVPILPPGRPDPEHHLGGIRPLRAALAIHWRRFFGADPDVLAMKLNHSLTGALFALPPDGASLARLNLERGRALGLPSGRDVALALGHKPLEEHELLPPAQAESRDAFWPVDDHPRERAAVLQAPPLWFYLLREARVAPATKGTRIGPIGGRIVGEVLVGLLEGDPESWLNQQPGWTPTLGRGAFEMLDLIDVAVGPAGAPTTAGDEDA